MGREVVFVSVGLGELIRGWVGLVGWLGCEMLRFKFRRFKATVYWGDFFDFSRRRFAEQ